jgi:flagellin-like protein
MIGKMYKRIWKDRRGVSPVIATILMVAITVVLAGVLVVYMQAFSQGPGSSNTLVSMVSGQDSNPSQLTKNSDLWSVDIVKVQGAEVDLSLTTTAITLKTPSGALVSTLIPNINGADISYIGGLPKWFMDEYTTNSANYDEGGVVQSVSANAGSIQGNEFNTIEGGYMIYLDNDGGSTISAGDSIIVYMDNNADGARDLASNTRIEISTSHDIIGGTLLS